MAYKVFERTSFRPGEPTLTIGPDARIVLNAAAVRTLQREGVSFVLLLWDERNNRLALKAASEGDKNAFTVSIVPDKHSGSIRAKSFFRHIGWSATRRVPLIVTWNGKGRMFEVNLPTEYLGRERESGGPT